MGGLSSSRRELALRIENAILSCTGDRTRSAAITIFNATGAPVRYRLRHDIHGAPYMPFPAIVDNGEGQVALHVRKPYALYGSEGYVVYTAQNGDGKVCDVLLCFMTSYQRIRCVCAGTFEQPGRKRMIILKLSSLLEMEWVRS